MPREVEQGMRRLGDETQALVVGLRIAYSPVMALSKRDQEFYEQKLNMKWTGLLFLYTTLMGAISVPVVLYMQDASAGQTSKWSGALVTRLATEGFLLGSVVAVVMYLGFKFLLQMGWLPSRR